MEWINIVWAWIENNIMPFLTTANLVAVVSIVIALLRQKTTIKDNTSISHELKQMIKDNSSQNDYINTLKGEISNLKALVWDLSDELAESNIKANAILDILYNVYEGQTAVDTECKKRIKNFYLDSRYASTKTRQDIAKQAEELNKQAIENAKIQSEYTDKIRKLVGEPELKSKAVNAKVNF